MANGIPKREVKDSVFTALFQDKKNLLRLYRELHPEDESVSEDDIEDVRLKPVIVDAEYNDLGFSVRDHLMVLIESQSTWTVNIIIRALMYLVNTYHEYYTRTNQNLYSSKKVRMPKPELYVVFVGDRKDVPNTISLSKEFFDGEKVAIDVEVKILCQENEDKIIGQYTIFCKVYDEQRKLYGRTKQAIENTIRICKDRNVLKEFLAEREREVVDMMMSLFSDEQILKAYAKDIEDSTAHREARSTAERMIKAGKMTLEEIADYLPALSLEELKELETEVMQLA